jgi:hypothetical protein
MVELRRDAFAHAVDLFDNWVIAHGLLPINSLGVQIAGAKEPLARQRQFHFRLHRGVAMGNSVPCATNNSRL